MQANLMRIFKKTAYFLIFCLLMLPVSLQAAGSFRYLGVSAGLGSRKVYQIEKDPSGYLWLFTQTGMERYDGSSFRRYTLQNTSSLSENISTGASLTQDKDGVVWLSLPNGSVYRYDSGMDCFDEVFHLHLDSLVTLRDVKPLNVSEVIVATSIGLYLRSGEKTTLLGMEGIMVNSISESSDGSLWLASNEGLWRCSSTGGNPVKIQQVGNLPIIKVLESDGKIFLGTFDQGVWVWDMGGQTISRVMQLPKISARTICPSFDGNVLIGMDGAGIFIMEPKSLTVVGQYLSNEDEPGSLSDNTVTDIAVDGDNYIWVATSTNGVSYLVPDRYSPSWLKHSQSGDQSLDNDHINVIYQDRDGDLWFGTNRGVNLLHDGQWKHFLSLIPVYEVSVQVHLIGIKRKMRFLHQSRFLSG